VTLLAWVKMEERDPGRPNGRTRVRILNDRTNELVCYPNGRTRWFGSDEEASAWIREATSKAVPREVLRVWRGQDTEGAR